MNPSDFVYSEIYKGSLRDGSKEHHAMNNAVMGLEDYKKGKFKKISELIKRRISMAKRDTKRN